MAQFERVASRPFDIQCFSNSKICLQSIWKHPSSTQDHLLRGKCGPHMFTEISQVFLNSPSWNQNILIYFSFAPAIKGLRDTVPYTLLRRSVCMHATARPKQRGPSIGSSGHAACTVRLCVSHALDTATEGCPRGHKHSILSPSRLYASYAAMYTTLHALLRLHDCNNYCKSHHCCRYSPDDANALVRRSACAFAGGRENMRETIKGCLRWDILWS